MTDKVLLSNVTTFTNDTSAVATVNANMAAITTAMDNTLSRDGTSPNTMGANLDMNSNRILNLVSPVNVNEPVTLNFAQTNYGNALAYSNLASAFATTATNQAVAATNSATAAATSATNAAASATSAAASAAVIHVAAGKTFTVNNTLTLAGIDSTTLTFQGTDTYVGRSTTDTLTNKTISGASNTLSNIGNGSLTNSSLIVGSTSISLGGTATTLAGLTSVSSATIYGGSAAGSTLTLQSTSSGSPSGDSLSLNTGGSTRATVLSNGFVGLGDTNPQHACVINMNSTSGFHTNGWIGFVVYGANATSGVGINLANIGGAGGITCARIDGTLASPANLSSGDEIGSFVYSGWCNGALLGGAVELRAVTTENWTTTAGAYWELLATPSGGTATQAMRVQAGVIIGANQTSDPGSGSLFVSSNTSNFSPTGGISGAQLYCLNANGSPAIISPVTFNNGTGTTMSTVILATSRGTAASISATQSGDGLGQFGFVGYDGSAWTNSRARIFSFTTENWTTTNRGCGFEFDTTAAGGNVRSQAMRVVNGVIIGAGTSDPGSGNLTASGTLQGAGLLSNADPGGTASNTTITNANSTTISTGTGTVKMSSANNANNAAWLKIYIGTTAYWIPAWTTNSP